jgi:hypothetical protein
MCLCGGVQRVDRPRRSIQCRVEAERVVRRSEIVVDGLGHADDAHASLSKRLSVVHRAVTAYQHEHVDRV